MHVKAVSVIRVTRILDAEIRDPSAIVVGVIVGTLVLFYVALYGVSP